MRRAVEGGRLSSGRSGAGASHGGDLLVEVSAVFEVLLDVVSAVPVTHLHGPATLADIVPVGMIVAGELAPGLNPDRFRIVLCGAGESKAGQLRVADGNLVFPPTAVLIIKENNGGNEEKDGLHLL